MKNDREQLELPGLMVGTAGHVDHGKTSLLKLLTGCETDRLKEEKERGLSIDLGFATCRLPGRRMVGVIDVPGHIDFIRNMVAGASSIDILILVVAADDGVMPQTIEHAQILKLLRAPKVMVALTKIDLVDPELLDIVKEDVSTFLSDMGFSDVPVVPVSNATGEGIGEIRKTLAGIVDQFPTRDTRSVFRMNIERVFSVKGFGTVVTGIPETGQASVGDQLVLLPEGKKVKLRSAQRYHQESSVVSSNICCALNISDVKTDSVQRGMTLAQDGFFEVSYGAVASLTNITDDLRVKHNSKLRLHTGTNETEVKLKIIGEANLKPGATIPVGLVFENPMVLSPGDRYILRGHSPSRTIGGGMILWPRFYKMKRQAPAVVERLANAVRIADEGHVFQAALMASESPMIHLERLNTLATTCSIDSRDIPAQNVVEFIDEALCVINGRENEVAGDIEKILKKYHAVHRYTWGMTRKDLSSALDISEKGIERLLVLISTKSDSIISKRGRIAMRDFKPAFSAKEMEIKENLLKLVSATNVKGLPIKQSSLELGVPQKEMRRFINVLQEEEEIVVVGGSHLMSVESLDTCVDTARSLTEEQGVFELADFRGKIDAGRNMTVAILEKLDELGVTKRTDEGRVAARQ